MAGAKAAESPAANGNGTKDAEAKAPPPPDHKTLTEALLAAQREMPAVERDKTNPHFKSKFVSLDNLLSKVRPVLNKHGLVLMQTPMLDGALEGEEKFVLKTTILHTSGEELEFYAPLTPAKSDPQSQGSAITYMRRYTLAAVLAIADQEDDDGQAAEASSRQGERDPQPAQAARAEQDQAATAPQTEPPAERPPVVDPESVITELLGKKSDLKEKREQANEGMKRIGASPEQRLRELNSATTAKALDALIARINNAMDGGGAGE